MCKISSSKCRYRYIFRIDMMLLLPVFYVNSLSSKAGFPLGVKCLMDRQEKVNY